MVHKGNLEKGKERNKRRELEKERALTIIWLLQKGGESWCLGDFSSSMLGAGSGTRRETREGWAGLGYSLMNRATGTQ